MLKLKKMKFLNSFGNYSIYYTNFVNRLCPGKNERIQNINSRLKNRFVLCTKYSNIEI